MLHSKVIAILIINNLWKELKNEKVVPWSEYQQQLFQKTETVNDVHVPRKGTVAKWVALFQVGRENLNDGYRSGRPITVHDNANIE